MVHRVFSIYDSKAEAYLRPFLAQTKGMAVRSLQAAMMDPAHDFVKFAGDYTLFELGEFEDATGRFVGHQANVNLGCLIEYKAQEVR